MSTPEQIVEAHSARVREIIDAAFREFALRFRRDIGRPMTKEEWTLARLAHATGFSSGADDSLRLLECLQDAEDAVAGTAAGEAGRGE